MAGVFDRRRIPAPESSFPPIFEPSDEPEAGPSKRAGRSNDHIQDIFLQTGLVTQANGSAYIEQGGVKIACSVYGPRPKQPPYSSTGTLNLEVKFAPFASHSRRAPLRDTEPLPLSALISQSLLPAIQLHLLPKSSLDIHLLILESSTTAAVLSAGLTVASAAVADAGISMNGLGVGGTALRVGKETLLDPSAGEEASGNGLVCLGSLPAQGKVTGVWISGELEVEELCDLIDKAGEAGEQAHTTVAHTLLEEAEARGVGLGVTDV
ncbi:ribosomal protein S5 domain 2-like protein [Naematelia encephala]|uniref:Ribosomal protein S5 domain 2-like protein n=1 Tax=Naematelia encephala TaxID=71784 RepID=A0A1Y2AEY7_9TREE|nr:ribosomal protein S5 domain 2-like protein [Naematelia encephala]